MVFYDGICYSDKELIFMLQPLLTQSLLTQSLLTNKFYQLQGTVYVTDQI